jgi:hypothetical protein
LLGISQSLSFEVKRVGPAIPSLSPSDSSVKQQYDGKIGNVPDNLVSDFSCGKVTENKPVLLSPPSFATIRVNWGQLHILTPEPVGYLTMRYL